MEEEHRKFLERRKRWEPVVVQMLREDFDAEIVSVNVQYRDPEVPHFAAEIDFEWRGDDGLIRNGEIKTVAQRAFSARFEWGEEGTEEIPYHYGWQVQYAFGVTRRPGPTIVAAMVGIDDLVFYPVQRDETAIAHARAAADKFWNENVLARVAPEPQTIEDLAKLYPATQEGLEVAADSDVGSKAMRYRAAGGTIAALTMEMDSLEFDLKLAMKGAEFLVVDGRRVLKWADKKWGRLDMAALKLAEKKIHKQYYLSGVRREFTAYKDLK